VVAAPSEVTGVGATPISASLTGLLPNTTYDFKAIGEIENGEVVGTELSFTTTENAPLVTTNSATDIEKNTVTLNATINAQNSSTNALFAYGSTLGVYTDTVAANQNPVNNGLNTIGVTGSISGLTPNTKYYFLPYASNNGGTTQGTVDSLTTRPEPPVVTTVSPTPNAIDIASDANIVINFDQGMDNSTLDDTTIVVTGSMRGIYSGSFSYGATSVTFDPDSVFFPGEFIQVNISEGAESASFNEPLATFTGYSFVAEQVDGSEVFANTTTLIYTPNNTEQVRFADFNNDGALDIATSGSSNVTYVRINNGDGTFPNSQFNTLSGSIGLTTGDMDKDGNIDLVYTRNGGGISVYLNNGSNPFPTGQNLSGSSDARNIEVADIDGDGYLDFIFTESGVKTVLNNGVGRFNSPSANTYTASGAWDVSVVDVNNDNHPDIITSLGSTGGVMVLTNDGDGTFTSDSTYAAGSGSQGVQAIDVNGDDVLDIVVSNLSSDNISVLIGNGDGTFAAAVNYAVADEPYDFIAFDMNGDGYPDIATTHQSIDSVSTMVNNGDGTFAAPTYYLTGDGPRGIAAGDVNNDGEMDLLTADYLDESTLRLKTPLAPSIASSTPAANAFNVTTTSNITVNFDIPIDPSSVDSSKISVIGSLTGEYYGSFTSITSTGFTFDPDSTFNEAEFITVTLAGIESASGIPSDVLSYEFVTPFPTVSSTKEFIDGGTFESVTAPVEMLRTDVDDDGDLDLLIAGNSNQLYTKLNNGDGTFATLANYSITANVSDIHLVDINGDGKLDVMSAHLSNGGTDTWTNDGDGTFTSAFGGFGTLSAIVTTDLDNDGHIDVIGANPSDNGLSFNRNQGNNSYQPPGFGGSLSFAAGTTPSDIAMADLNGDGRPDFVTANSGSNNVSYFMNNGDGTVADSVNYAVGNGPSSVVITDLDGDGNADLIVSNETSDNVSVLINNGDGTFGTRTAFGAGDEPVSVVMLDYDGDGDNDLLVANKTGNTISVIELTGGPSVVEVLPMANRLAVPVDTNLTVTFDRTMNATTLNANSVSVVGTLSGRFGGTYTLNDSVLTIDPSSDFEHGEKVTVTVTTNVQDSNNDAMETMYSSAFIVEADTGQVLFQKVEYNLSTNLRGLTTADLDGDGDNDIIVSKSSNSQISVHLNDGAGSFSSGTDYSVGSSPSAISVADLDNDGDIDVTVTYSSGNNVSVLLNNGNGTFGSAVNYTAAFSIEDVTHEDVNGDGYLDILLARYQLGVLLNDGDGTFGSLLSYSGSGNSTLGQRIGMADMDNDGDLDAVMAATSLYTSQRLQIVYNTGNGVFEGNETFELEGKAVRDLVTSDFDNDGWADIAIVDSENNVVQVFTNNGDGTIDTTATVSVNDDPIALTAADYDGDGDLDIAVYNEYEQFISIILNNGNATFGSATTYQTNQLTAFNPGMVSADFDGDNRLDIAFTYGNGFNVMLPTPPLAAPSNPATGLNFYSTTGTSTGVSANRGSSDGMLVIMKQGSPVDFVPTDDVSYPENTTFGAGTDLGGGNYAVINTNFASGKGISGLTRNTEYHVAVFVYNSGDGQISYNTVSAPIDSVTTLTSPNSEGFVSIDANNGSQLTIDLSSGNGTSRILAIREGSAVTWTPTDSTTYAADTSFTNATDLGDGTKIIRNSSSTSDFIVTGLSLNTTYHFALFEYYGGAGTENYYTTPATTVVTTNDYAGLEFSQVSGNAAYLPQNGSTDYVETDFNELPANYTFELWIKPETLNAEQTILSYEQDSIVIGMNTSNHVFATHINGTDTDISITGTTALTEGSWHHIALVAETGANLTLYVNGYNEASAPISDAEIDERDVYFGKNNNEDKLFNGYIDEIRAFKVARTQSEIRSTMHTTISGFATDMIGYWQFDGESGDNSESDLISNESIRFRGDATRGKPGAPVGLSTTNVQTAFSSGTATIGNASLTLTDGFDSPVDIYVSEINTPTSYPTGFGSSLGDTYFIINVFGNPGVFSANLTLNYGMNVIPSSFDANPDTLKLYKRASATDSSWTDLGGAIAVNSTTGDAT
jgi:hypothetical protein